MKKEDQLGEHHQWAQGLHYDKKKVVELTHGLSATI